MNRRLPKLPIPRTAARSFAVVAVLAMGLTAAPPAVASVPTLSPSGSHHYRVHGDGTPPLPSLSRGTMVRAHGDEFVVGQRLVDAKHKTYRMVFLVRRHGSEHWTQRVRSASSPDIYKYTTYSAQVSPDGRAVVIEVNSCAKNKVYVIEAPMRRFGASPKIRLAESGDDYTCEYPNSDVKYAPFVAAAASAHHMVTLVFYGLPDPTYSQNLDPLVAVSTGSVEHGFPPPHALPSPPGGQARPTALTRDPSTGELTVVANSRDGRQGIYVYNKTVGGSWTGPTAISPPLQPTSQNTGEADSGIAVTARRGHVTVWMCQLPLANDDPDEGDTAAHATCGTVDRGSEGRWGAFMPYPEMTNIDYQGFQTTLIANPKTGSVHLLWSQPTSQYGYLHHAVRVHGKWSSPQTLLRVHHGVVVDLSVALTSAGHPVVGFRIPGN